MKKSKKKKKEFLGGKEKSYRQDKELILKETF
jgi:hypothetical protein